MSVDSAARGAPSSRPNSEPLEMISRMQFEYVLNVDWLSAVWRAKALSSSSGTTPPTTSESAVLALGGGGSSTFAGLFRFPAHSRSRAAPVLWRNNREHSCYRSCTTPPSHRQVPYLTLLPFARNTFAECHLPTNRGSCLDQSRLDNFCVAARCSPSSTTQPRRSRLLRRGCPFRLY